MNVEVANEVAKQSAYLTRLMPLIKNVEPSLNLSKHLAFLTKLYDVMRKTEVCTNQGNIKIPDTKEIIAIVDFLQKHPFVLRQGYLVFKGIEKIEALSEEMQDRFWSAYKNVSFEKMRPLLAELGTKTPMEVMTFILSFPKPKKKKSAFKKAYKFLEKTSVVLAVLIYSLQLYEISKQHNRDPQMQQLTQEQVTEQEITELLKESLEKASIDENDLPRNR